MACLDQVLVIDITYDECNGKFYFRTFIIPQYYRRIIGYSASKTLSTENTTIPGLKMALTRIKGNEQVKHIIHSDGGGQYYSNAFLNLTRGCLRNSMCESVYENPHAERVNGTIKNGYLKGYHPTSLNDLERKLNKAVYMYN